MEEWVQHLPTARVVNKEIGLPLEHLTAAFGCSRNTLNKRLDELPFEGPITSKEEIIQILDLYESALHDYKAKNYKLGRAAEEQWQKEKVKYKEALERELEDNLSLSEFKKQSKNRIDMYRDSNKKQLLKAIEKPFQKLDLDQALRFAFFYDGYAGLLSTPSCKIDLILSSISILNLEAKQKIKRLVDNMEMTVGRFAPWVIFNGKAISDIRDIRYKNTSDFRKGMKSAWDKFQDRFNHNDYEYALNAAAMIVIYSTRKITDDDFDITMKCAFFLDLMQQSKIFSKIQEMLTPENIQPEYDMEDVEEILELSKYDNIMIRLEHYLGVESEDELGIYENDNPGDE